MNNSPTTSFFLRSSFEEEKNSLTQINIKHILNEPHKKTFYLQDRSRFYMTWPLKLYLAGSRTKKAFTRIPKPYCKNVKQNTETIKLNVNKVVKNVENI